MSKPLPPLVLSLTAVALLLLCGLAPTAVAARVQRLDVRQALGTWRSTERFEGEPRVTVAFRKEGATLVGWATMLGVQRGADNRATLGFSFCDVRWADDRLLFQTILPDDEGTTGWEMRLTSDKKGTLRAVTENGARIDEPPVWEMTRQDVAPVIPAFVVQGV